jgi:hypothetical protein
MRSYLGHAACFIDTEAPGRLPLLKRLLNLDSKHLYRPIDGAGVADEHLAHLYAKHGTAGMNAKDKARFLADMLRPSNRLAGWNNTVAELLDLGDEGALAVIDMLRDEEGKATDLKMSGACECANGARGILLVGRGKIALVIREMDVAALKSDFVKYTVASYMVGVHLAYGDNSLDIGRSAQCIDLHKDLWNGYPLRLGDAGFLTVRGEVAGGALGLRGNMGLLFYFLKSLDGDETSQDNEVLRARVLQSVEIEMTRFKQRLGEDQKAYLAEFAGRRIDTDPANFEKNTAILRVAELRVANQARCLELLKAEPVHQR